MNPIIINFNDLLSNSNLEPNFIQKALGQNSLGVILISNIPNIQKLRKELLFAGRKFVSLDDKTKTNYENKDAFYAVGWSYGKEKMKNNKPDFAKGSYYANPLVDNPTNDEELIKKYPGSYTPNVWPQEIPEFEKKFKELGQLIYNVGLMVLKYCDEYVDSEIKLEKLMRESKTCKGRFLHYFPNKTNNITNYKKDDAACGWHCDSGCLTGLISALYFDNHNQPIFKPKDSGLFIKDRKDNFVKINIPENCVAFQIGEIIQILSGNLLIATPHCVKSCKDENITRNTLAIFMDVNPMYSIKVPKDMENKMDEILDIKNLPEGIPKLKDRFYNGIKYGEFLDKTYQAYYN